ncbi:MAG: DNA internalization-related competence protein ComEC/Rec2 [Bacteroidota bacterium]
MSKNRHRHFFRAHPAVGLAVSFGAGIFIANALDVAPTTWLTVCAGWSVVLLCILFWPGRKSISLRRIMTTACLLSLTIGLGGFWFTTYYAASTAHVGHRSTFFHTDATQWSGEVEECVPTRTRFRCTVRLHTVSSAALPDEAVEGRIHAFMPDALQALPLTAGDRIAFEGALSPLAPRRNPADFDYGRYLWLEKIAGTVWLDTVPQITQRATWSVRQHVRSLQERIRHHVRQHVASAEAQALTLALLLGERSGLADETRSAFTSTGLAHLLAVSGLHVMLVGFVLYRLLGSLLARTAWSWRARQGIRTMLTLGVLVVYLLLTGASTSVVRAVVMTALLLGTTLVHRPHLSLNALGLAALLLLIAKPGALFQAGFQLSFAAVSGIVVFYPLIMPALPGLGRLPMGKAIAESTTVTMAATWTTAPVLLVHFGYVPLAGLLLNLIAIPLTAALLLASLLLTTLGAIPGLGEAFGAAIELAAHSLTTLAQHGQATMAWATLRLTPDEYGLLLPLLLAIAATALWTAPRWRWRLGLSAMAAYVVLIAAPLVQTPSVSILFFDVGHGDAALLSFPDDRHILIDTGGYAGRSTHAERTLLPHFERYGITHLDAVVISHPHADHDGGLATLLDAIPINRIIYNGEAGDRELASLAYQKADLAAIPLQSVRAGDTLSLSRHVQTRVLWPPMNDAYLSANNQSLVLQMFYRDVALLFLGDVEGIAEMHIAEQFGQSLSSTLVKVAHHGSRTSSQPALVAAMAHHNTQAVISADRGHRYGLPDEDVEQRWMHHGIRPFVTSDHGALWFTTDGDTVQRVDWR